MALGICLLVRHIHVATVTTKQAEVSPETRGNVINSRVTRISWKLLFQRGDQTQKYKDVVMWAGGYSVVVLPHMCWALGPIHSTGGKKEGVASCKLLTVNNLMPMWRESHCI